MQETATSARFDRRKDARGADIASCAHEMMAALGVTSTNPSPNPRLGDATPLALLRPPAEILNRLVSAAAHQPQRVGGQVVSVRSDVPGGEWLIWADRGCALWIGDSQAAMPSLVREQFARGTTADVIEAIDWLADAGIWCREGALLLHDGWSAVRHAELLFRDLPTSDVRSLSGIFVDRAGRAGSLEFAGSRACWTDHPTLAIEWLLTAAELPPPT